MSTDFSKSEDKRVVIIMTSGPSSPERCATPFFVASLLASMDAEVKVFLTMEAVLLAQDGVADNLSAMNGGKSVLHFMRESKKVGVQIYMCQPALPGYNMENNAKIIPEIDVLASGGVLADLILTSDKVITF
jgi:predicted peroxiredoxin